MKTFTHASEREFATPRPRGPAALSATRCYGGGGGGQSSSAQTQSTTTADNGSVVAGRDIVSGLNITDAGGNVTVTGGAELLAKTNADWQRTLEDFASGAAVQQQSTLQEVLSAVSGLAEQQASAGASQLQKTALYIGLAGLGLVGLLAFAAKRSSK